MRAFIILTSVLATWCATAQTKKDGDLRHLVSLLGSVQIGSDYETIKKLAPEIGAVHKDAGDNNTEASIAVSVDGVELTGEFNFSKGRLVSHGFRSGDITHEQAHTLLLRAASICHELLGESKRRVELPNEHDGPRDSVGVSFNWQTDNTLIGLNFEYRSKAARVQWGAQHK